MESFLNWITENQQIIYIVVLMIFVGIEVIGHVPSVLHTPLMSGSNFVHGVVLVGAMVALGISRKTAFDGVIGHNVGHGQPRQGS